MADSRVTSIGKQAVWKEAEGTLVTAIGKQVSFPTHNDTRITAIGKQVVWSDSGHPAPPPPPTPPGPLSFGPGAVLGRGGTVYVDSALEYDGRNVATSDGLFPGVTVSLSGGTTWLPGETLTLTAVSPGPFVSGDVGNVLVLHQTDPVTGVTIATVRFTITGYTSATVVTGTADITIPTAMRSGSIVVWDRLIDQVTGLAHLEGEAVSILGDEHVIASPNNARLAIVTVASGTVALGDFYSRVVVGLPYLSDLETLDIDSPQGGSLKGQRIAITKVGVMIEQSRPVWLGGSPPDDDTIDPLQDLQEVPMPNDINYERYLTDYVDFNIPSRWTNHGRVFARSVDPVACNVLAIVAHGYVPQPG